MPRSQRIRVLLSWIPKEKSKIPEDQDPSLPDPEGRTGGDAEIPKDQDPPFPGPQGRIPNPRGSGPSSPSPSSLSLSLRKIPGTPALPTILYFSLQGIEPRGTNQLWHENQGALPVWNRAPLDEEDAEIPPWNHQEVSPEPPL